MHIHSENSTLRTRGALVALGFGLVVVCANGQNRDDTAERIHIAAANMQDAIVIDCQLPGKLRKLGGTRTYLTPGRLIRTSAVVCRTRGGEYTLGDLASGTLSLQRWLNPAGKGDAEAQYYVARIHANGMDNVPVDYAEAARWYQKAADQGFSEAKQELGYLYERGLGVEKDTLKALNLQRDASGLGEDLDYAYKIADAKVLAEELATQLRTVNGALRDSQLELRETQDRLSAARNTVRHHELQLVGMLADLAEARRLASNSSSPKVDQLEEDLVTAKAQLEQSQTTILDLERERDSARAALATQLVGGQATQRELRELLARTERTEQDATSLGAQLGEAQQRLIHSDEEVRELQIAYREQSDRLVAERARLLKARSRSDSDAAAYLAAKETEIASKAARITSLESQVQGLKVQLAESQDSGVEDALRREVEALQARYDNDVEALRRDRDGLSKSYSASKEELATLYAKSRQRLSAEDDELKARKREIEMLAAESAQLRARVDQLQAQQIQQAEQSGSKAAKLQAQLSTSRQQVISLTISLDEERAGKLALEAKLLKDRMALQDQLVSDSTANAQEIDLLRAEIAAAESTINAQTLRIAALEGHIQVSAVQLGELKDELGEPEPAPLEAQDAMIVLEMARSPQEPDLGRFHALLIANEKYTNMEPLTTPVRDANDIEKLLISRYGFSVKVLTNATDDDIMRTLHEYSNTLTQEDNLLIYYAGRGSTPDGPPDRAYWLGVDADPRMRNTWLLAEHVSDKIREIEAKRILLITDSCFSRRRVQASTMSVGRGLGPERFKLLAKFQSRYVLTSGANVPVFDDKGDRTHSLFAKFFMEILRQNSNVLTGEMLAYEMSHRVRERIKNPEHVTPTYSSLQGAGHKAGDFFFVPTLQPTLFADASSGQDSA